MSGSATPTASSTRLTRLAELGLPVHVLQRYAGHASPTMSMHYIASREEHAEQASWPPSSSGPTAPGSRSPARTTTSCACPAGRPDPPARLVPAAATAVLRQGQRLPDLPGLRHRPDPPASARAAACRNRRAHHPDHRSIPAAPRPPHARGQHLARAGPAEQQALARLLTAVQSAPGRAVRAPDAARHPPGGPAGPRPHRHRRTGP